MLSTQFQCRDCGSVHAFRSRSRTWTEKYLFPIFLLRSVRCAKCFRRDCVSIFLAIPERPHREETRQVAA
jgi:hypothetical protein